MNAEAFARMDELNLQWAEFEKNWAVVEVEVENTPISIKRHGQKLRVMYYDKPVSDLKVFQRIEAVQHAAELKKAVTARLDELESQVGEAVKTLKRINGGE